MTNSNNSTDLSDLHAKIEDLEKAVDRLNTENKRLSLESSFTAAEVATRCVKRVRVAMPQSVTKIFIIWLMTTIAGELSFSAIVYAVTKFTSTIDLVKLIDLLPIS